MTSKNFATLFTPKGTFVYPRLNVPDTKFKKEGVYSVQVRLTGAEGEALIAKLQPMADEAYENAKVTIKDAIKEAKGAKLAKLKESLAKLEKSDLPVKPTYNDDGTEDGGAMVSIKMNAQFTNKKGEIVKLAPIIVDSTGKNLENPPDIWGGTVGKVKAQIVPYYNASVNNAGVSLRLVSVQIIELVSKGGGDQGFDEEEGGYVGDDLPKQKVADEDNTSPAGEAGEDETPDF